MVIVVWLVAQADRSARSDRRKTPAAPRSAPRSGATGHARPAALRPLPPPGKARSAPTHPATPPDRDRDRCPKLYGTRLQGRARVIDGDTIVVAGQRIRLAGIDAPELDEPFGQESKWEMVRLCQGQKITVRLNGFRSYERGVGFCYLPDGTDLGAYAEALFARYSNPAIRHRTWQIAMDGSQKLPQRLLGTLRDNLDAGRASPGLCVAVAAWMRYVGGIDESGNPIDVRDPLADRLRKVSDSADNATERVAAFLAMEDIFDPDLADRLRVPLTVAAELVWTRGARGAAQEASS